MVFGGEDEKRTREVFLYIYIYIKTGGENNN
jgi:hypothetical protein